MSKTKAKATVRICSNNWDGKKVAKKLKKRKHKQNPPKMRQTYSITSIRSFGGVCVPARRVVVFVVVVRRIPMGGRS